MVERYQGIPSNGQKSKLLGGCIPPSPLDLQPCRRQRHYQLKLFNKYEINGKYINNGIENQTINKLSKYYHEKSIKT